LPFVVHSSYVQPYKYVMSDDTSLGTTNANVAV